MDNKLIGYFILADVVILMTFVIKDDDNFKPQIFLEESLLIKSKCSRCLMNKTNHWQHMELFKMKRNFIHNYFDKKPCFLNKHGNNT